MTAQTIPQRIRDLYGQPAIHGRRITRWEETDLGAFNLTAETAWELGCNNVGAYIGGTPTLGPTLDILRQIEIETCPAVWVVVAATIKMAAVIIQQWFLARSQRRIALTTLKMPQSYKNVVLATPESLKDVEAAMYGRIAGIIVVDMLLNVHAARGMKNKKFLIEHDRPQLVASFRNSLNDNGWSPPLLLFTQKPAKANYPHQIAPVYGLDAFWLVDGRTVKCGRPEVESATARGRDDKVAPPR